MKKSELRQLIKEEINNQSDYDGLKSSRATLYGTKQSRIVIEGPGAEKFKKEILVTLKKQDPTHTVKFFDTTKKFVGNFSTNRLDSLKRDIKNKNVSVFEKPLSKSLKKI